MKLRLLPVIISISVSAVLLFGGWFVYQSVAMENPLAEAVESMPGVQLVHTSIMNTETELEVKLQPGTSLREVYSHIQIEGKQALGKRELKLKVANDTSPQIEQWWSSALFDVAQAMETKKYAEIPVKLEARAASTNGLKVSTEMDDKYVYITLSEGDYYKYVMLPRKPAVMGVWSNE